MNNDKTKSGDQEQVKTLENESDLEKIIQKNQLHNKVMKKLFDKLSAKNKDFESR